MSKEILYVRVAPQTRRRLDRMIAHASTLAGDEVSVTAAVEALILAVPGDGGEALHAALRHRRSVLKPMKEKA